MKLRDKKVLLRPIKLTDASRFVKWFNDPEVHKFLARRKLTLKEERAWIKSIPKVKDSLHFCIDTRDSLHIGSVGLNNINRLDGYATFGIMIGDKHYWGQGYGREAMQLIIDYGFRHFKLHRIELEVYSYNLRGIKLYKRLGFKLEGRKRQRIKWGSRYYDALQMGLLRPEWLKSTRRS
jgi:RimJ/RimL family protein N-acetyltransferase